MVGIVASFAYVNQIGYSGNPLWKIPVHSIVSMNVKSIVEKCVSLGIHQLNTIEYYSRNGCIDEDNRKAKFCSLYLRPQLNDPHDNYDIDHITIDEAGFEIIRDANQETR